MTLWDTNPTGNLYSASSQPAFLGPSGIRALQWRPGSKVGRRSLRKHVTLVFGAELLNEQHHFTLFHKFALIRCASDKDHS